MPESWYHLSAADTLAKLAGGADGLSAAEVAKRQQRYGPNQLAGHKKPNPVLVFLRQFLSPLIYVLLAAVVFSFILGHYADAWVILGVLLLNAVIGYVQEQRAEKAMEALISLAAPQAQVRRDGASQMLAARELVPGDIVILDAGDKVPADARIIEAANFQVNESILTGESVPVEKHVEPLTGELPVAERKNMVFAGTVVTYGRAVVAVTETAMATEIGRIATGLQAVQPEATPLQKGISRLSKYLVFLFLGICILLVVVGLLKGLDWLDVFLLAVAAAVSAIPEGLPAVVTVVLAMGMRMMARRNAVIRKLVAVETLGSATVICSDKTGTLTLNQMTVRRLYVGGREIEVTGEGYAPEGEFRRDGQALEAADEGDIARHLRIGALCNDAELTRADDGTHTIFGDPTEGSLVVAAAKAGLRLDKLAEAYPRLDEIPFQSEHLYMATLHPAPDGKGRVAYVKGAAEKLLSLSKSIIKDGKVVPLSDADIKAIQAANHALASDAMRVIATAYVDLPAGLDDLEDKHLKDLVFVGLSALADPPREEAREAVRRCERAGIKVIMITGDNKTTAESIARQVGIPPGRTVTGSELAAMSDAELAAGVEDVSVFARIEPIQKLRIVNALKGRGHVVAMTGDGVNDAPALKTANIGIAMGITGTDVAKEAADMTLADDNFASVVAAVDEGRVIFNRLRNVLFFLLSTNIGELLALILGIFFVGKPPVLAVQILWNNIATDMAVTIPLGVEPKSGDELSQPPRDPRVGILYPGLLLRVLFTALIMGVGSFAVFNWAQARMPIEEARTITFCTLVTFEWFRAFNARSDERTVFKLGLFRNRWLVGSIAVAVALQIAIVYVPFLQTAFHTVSLSPGRWGIAVIGGASLFVVEEVRKTFFPRLFSLGKWRPLPPGWWRRRKSPAS